MCKYTRGEENMNKKMRKRSLLMLALAVMIGLLGHSADCIEDVVNRPAEAASIEKIPEYERSPYIIVNENEPDFSEEELRVKPYEEYSPLDIWGRCREAEACVGPELMPEPDEERKSISSVEPTGWMNKEYSIVENQYLYNRCHLIGYQLTGENANERNLITGTRYFNVEGMLPFENEVADYIKQTGNHVMYRVTPIYDGADLVASGVQMEAKSVEDNGKGICYNVFVYNVQPGIEINYATGESRLMK